MAEAEQKICQNCKTQFTIEPEDFSFYEKMGVPPPVICPTCRMKQKLVWRNERTLYKRTCDLCKKSVISMYHPRAPYTVYCYDCWLSDKWDPMDYGMVYDPSRSFFEQLGALIRKVPKMATYTTPGSGVNINSEYTNFAGNNKDCYLVFNSGPNENCAYSRGIRECRDTFDTYYANGLERVYEGVNVQKSAGVGWAQNVLDSLDSWFLFDCRGCQYCFGCVNLRHKSYYFFNEPFSKEEWKSRVEAVLGSYSKMEEMHTRFGNHILKFPRKENNNLKSVRSIGDYIFESKNAYLCFEASLCEDVKYGFSIKLLKDSYDTVGYGFYSDLLLETVGVGYASRVIGTWWCEQQSRDIEYSLVIRTSHNCFGCDALKNASYCILNKQYSEEEYKKLRAQIIEELRSKNLYGLFLPPELALFAYNEALSQENLPLTKERVLAEGFRWEEDIPQTRGQETLKPEQIPDHIKDVPDSILNEVLVCMECGRNYRLIRAELDFYRRMMIPIPRKCFNCRHLDRLRRRGPLTLFDRTCDNCKKPIKTNYAPDRPEIVFCESCYQSEVT